MSGSSPGSDGLDPVITMGVSLAGLLLAATVVAVCVLLTALFCIRRKRTQRTRYCVSGDNQFATDSACTVLDTLKSSGVSFV